MKYDKNNGFIPEEGDEIGIVREPAPVCRQRISEEGYLTLYFDGENGDDNNDGRSENTPMKSVARMQEAAKTHAHGGLRLLLKCGTHFEGDLLLTGYSAPDEKPLIVDKYSVGTYPCIQGKESCVTVTESNTVIRNLEVTGREALRGIYVRAVHCGPIRNIVIENCYVHDINFLWEADMPPELTDPDTVDVEKVTQDTLPVYTDADGRSYTRYNRRSHGGIIFLNATGKEEGASRFENVFIENNLVKNVSRTGIYLANVWADRAGVGYGNNLYLSGEYEYPVSYERGTGYFYHENIVCCNNRIICAGGDGLIISSAHNLFLEHNVSYYANYLGRTGYWNAGIWVFDTVGASFRYNEAAFTYMRHGGNDAQGFDLDNACSEILFEYNYSHHNEGGGLLVCNRRTAVKERDKDGRVIAESEQTGRWYNNLIRNNLFLENGNERDKTRSAFITIARETDLFVAENNTVVLSGEIPDESIVNTEDESQYCYGNLYKNNLICSKKTMRAHYTVKMQKRSVFSGNVYVGVGTPFREVGEEAEANTECVEITKDTLGYEKAKVICARLKRGAAGAIFKE